MWGFRRRLTRMRRRGLWGGARNAARLCTTGDRVYYGRGTDHVLGCGQCIDAGFAREEQGGSHA